MKPPYIIIVAGPNGVGKSTFAQWYLKDFPDCVGIVDADVIARDLQHLPESGRNVAAGRIALETIEQHIHHRRSFAIESTLSGRTLLGTLSMARSGGYYIAIAILWVPSIGITSRRVESRARSGGHDIAMEDQIRRFDRCYINFFTSYRQICNEWTLYLGLGTTPEPLAKGKG
ncbi:MAG: Zeta toxin family protein [Candidatus Kapabacteria bacterium]|nr:Zeta toxin family protein [Candidatus Kapabacteria bacterium]